MTFFADLSPYTYRRGSDVVWLDLPSPGYGHVDAAYPRVNIGWLGEGRPFTTGTLPHDVVDGLLDVISEQRVNVMRGFHTCAFCPRNAELGQTRVDHGERTVWMGNSEIRVPAADGTVFAAPTLIGHYVLEHRYLPPAGFTDALTAYRRDCADDLARGWVPGPVARGSVAGGQ